MKKIILLIVTLLAVSVIAVPVLADDEEGHQATRKARHSLFFDGSTPPDTHLVCGAFQNNEPYTLNISGSATGAGGQFVIVFRDGDQMPFDVPAGSTYSTSHALGGVPGVDTPTVMIYPTGGVHSMMASVLAEDKKGVAFCTSCTGGLSGTFGLGGPVGHAGGSDPPQCNFPGP